MKRTITLTLCAFLAAAASWAERPEEKPVTEADSARILGEIRQRALPIYRQYRGILSVRRTVVKEYDLVKDRLLVTHDIRAERRDYFYEKPEIKVLEYKKDGAPSKPSKYNERKVMPAHPFFDHNGEKNYDIRVVSETKIGDVRCYRLRIRARQLTDRHVSGNLYVKTDGYEPVLLECTLAKLPFPLKEISMIYRLTAVDGVAVLTSGSLNLKIHVPMVNIRRKYVTTMVAESNRPLEK